MYFRISPPSTNSKKSFSLASSHSTCDSTKLWPCILELRGAESRRSPAAALSHFFLVFPRGQYASWGKSLPKTKEVFTPTPLSSLECPSSLQPSIGQCVHPVGLAFCRTSADPHPCLLQRASDSLVVNKVHLQVARGRSGRRYHSTPVHKPWIELRI
jgi:hypothetical protein